MDMTQGLNKKNSTLYMYNTDSLLKDLKEGLNKVGKVPCLWVETLLSGGL